LREGCEKPSLFLFVIGSRKLLHPENFIKTCAAIKAIELSEREPKQENLNQNESSDPKDVFGFALGTLVVVFSRHVNRGINNAKNSIPNLVIDYDNSNKALLFHKGK